MAEWLFSLDEVGRELPDESSAMRFAEAFRHGTMRLGLYAPRGTDAQTPHRQDELYVIVSGSGSFVKEGEATPFRANDVIFVEASAEHRFVDFSDDFSAWVIFWGRDGGED
ncbi:MAG TPA: cupin domain-containing protein [Sphingomicrobium sp.]|nr:cupin domain-containing protein [Sphingomicrobium sp.]